MISPLISAESFSVNVRPLTTERREALAENRRAIGGGRFRRPGGKGICDSLR